MQIEEQIYLAPEGFHGKHVHLENMAALNIRRV